MSLKNYIWISNDLLKCVKRIQINESGNYLKLGWYRGMNSKYLKYKKKLTNTHTKGRKFINNHITKEIKLVKDFELLNYINNGWELGKGKNLAKEKRRQLFEKLKEEFEPKE